MMLYAIMHQWAYGLIHSPGAICAVGFQSILNCFHKFPPGPPVSHPASKTATWICFQAFHGGGPLMQLHY